METENNQNVFSVSLTNNSKIIELSDGNRVIVQPNGYWAMGSHHFCVMSYGIWELNYRNRPSKQAIKFNI